MSRFLRLSSAHQVGKMASFRYGIARQQVAPVHTVKLVELHDNLHLEKETPIRLQKLRLRNIADSSTQTPEKTDVKAKADIENTLEDKARKVQRCPNCTQQKDDVSCHGSWKQVRSPAIVDLL